MNTTTPRFSRSPVARPASLGDEQYGEILQDPSHLKFVINHLFFPPQLPQGKDAYVQKKRSTLVSFLCEAAEEYALNFVSNSNPTSDKLWAGICKMLNKLLHGNCPQETVQKFLEEMDVDDILVFHLEAQNAGLIVRKFTSCSSGDIRISFESFEASPENKQAMATENRVLISYPSNPPVSISKDVYQDRSFLQELSSFLAEMSLTELPGAQVFSKKAGKTIVEERSPNKPIYINQLLRGILRGLGESDIAYPRITKRIADDILWDRERLPWRRDPLWLVIRVALQSSLSNPPALSGSKPIPSNFYKSFLLFTMGKILATATQMRLESDLLRVMQAKIARRLYKLKNNDPELQLVAHIHTLLDQAEQLLQKRWRDNQFQHYKSFFTEWNAKDVSFETEIELSLNNSKEYILEMKHSWDMDRCTHRDESPVDDTGPTHARFDSRFPPAHFLNIISHHQDPTLLLHDFELWVERHLSSWVTSIDSIDYEDSCATLAKCMDVYSQEAMKMYQDNPLGISMMILTLMDLWVEADKLAILCDSLLKDYEPGIPYDTFESLLLPKWSQMQRLSHVEQYLLRRKTDASHGSIFSQSSSFPIRYVNSHSNFLELLANIETAAHETRTEKLEEMRNANNKYDELLQKSKTTEHEKVWVNKKRGRILSHKERKCPSCILLRQAKALQVECHEWPLPQESDAKLKVVFELACPAWLLAWRDITYHIIVDICTPASALPKHSQSPKSTLCDQYIGASLGSFYENRHRRLAWMSPDKSFICSHYAVVSMSTTCPIRECDVCVPHAPHWALYDTKTQCWVKDVLGVSHYELSRKCTVKISRSSPYFSLQYALNDTTHSSNYVIANQEDCSTSIGLLEYEAFCTLRSGHRVQWLNIAREIVSRRLSFGREETYLLLLQAAWQAGPRTITTSGTDTDALYRDSHFLLNQLNFCADLILAMGEMLDRIESNWCEAITARTLILLTRRLLPPAQSGGHINQSFHHNTCTNDAISLLLRLRRVTYKWVKLVHELQTTNPTSNQEHQRHALEIALTCRMTFDIEPEYDNLTLDTVGELAMFVECGMIIQATTPAMETTLPAVTKMHLNQDRKATNILQPRLFSRMKLLHKAIDTAIKSMWQAYPDPDGNRAWIVNSPEFALGWLSKDIPGNPQDSQRTIGIKFQLYTGRLLVNGAPFGRLPHEYMKCQSYLRIFGQDILDVTPSDMPGMSYSLKTIKDGYRVHFNLKHGELIIRIQNDAHTLEVIPKAKFDGDLPFEFIERYAHFLDLDTGLVEFRPLEEIWKRSSEIWVMTQLGVWSSCPKWILKRNDAVLVDSRSKTKKRINQILAPLESERFIDVQIINSNIFIVNLPRYRLQFKGSRNMTELECISFPGWFVDRNQSMGTLIGLGNRLVLRQGCSQNSRYRNRCVLIPEGQVSWSSESKTPYMTVKITISDSSDSISYHKFSIDKILGRLVPTSSALHSLLYQAYLHAVTSFPLEDPLTSVTGTEYALEILHSARLFSFAKLTQHDLNLLKNIMNLTPSREYYPKHLTEMQTVGYSTLPAMAQHGEFEKSARAIVTHWERLSMFHEEEAQKLELPNGRGVNALLRRARIRNRVWYSTEFSSESDQSIHSSDTAYTDRVSENEMQQSLRVAHITRLIQQGTRELGVCNDLWEELQRWNIVEGASSAEITLESMESLHTQHLRDIWLTLAKLLYETKQIYKTIFLLAPLAFRDPVEIPNNMIETLLALSITTTSPLEFPAYSSYNLNDGVEPNQKQLRDLVSSCKISLSAYQDLFNDTCAPQSPLESYHEYWKRCTEQYNKDVENAIEEVILFFLQCWPCSRVPSPPSPEMHRRLLEINAYTITQVNTHFESWWRNRELQKFVQKLQSVIEQTVSSARPPELCASDIIFPYKIRTVKRFGACASSILELTIPPSASLNDDRNTFPKYVIHDTANTGHDQRQLLNDVNWKVGQSHMFELITNFETSVDPFKKIYGSALRQSWNALQNGNCNEPTQVSPQMTDIRDSHWTLLQGYLRSIKRISCISQPSLLSGSHVASARLLDPAFIKELTLFADHCLSYFELQQDKIRRIFHPTLPSSDDTNPTIWILHSLKLAGIWPRITPRSLLRTLTSPIARGTTGIFSLQTDRRNVIFSYGLAAAQFQQSCRFLKFAESGDSASFFNELDNSGYSRWDPLTYPDWLIFEIENDLRIRPMQGEVAREMLNPRDNGNTVMQMNMGEGKSSVLLPIIASTLADGKRLVQVLVLKPLAAQMFQLLVKKLGGILNRRVYYLPFSRSVKVNDHNRATAIQNLLKECMDTGGILLAHPEHALSFKLMGIEKIGEEDSSVAMELLKTYKWLEDHVRNIIDESDEVLSVKYQLLYTVGTQTNFDGAPDRWAIVQDLLDLVKIRAIQLRRQYPDEIEVEYLSGDSLEADRPEFPLTRITSKFCETLLDELLISDILSDQLPPLTLRFFPHEIKSLAKRFISNEDTTEAEYKALISYFGSGPQMNMLYCLRGLFSARILYFALKEKRYRVDYGLDLSRSMLAIPFRAKDSPSPRAEFGHADVTIMLTCLSYYYAGLTRNQLLECLNNLNKTDNPDFQYRKWVQLDPNIHPSLSQLSGINLLDQGQFSTQVFPKFRSNKATIDFYLSTVVFPQNAKQFPHKLSTSAWDLAERRDHLTTGFSGTNDNRYILPLSITQQDSPQQLHTNAKVLNYLLTLDRTFYERVESANGGRISILDLLHKVIEKDIQVLLDVGAQILEFTNHEVAMNWLQQIRKFQREKDDIVQKWQAAVYFDEQDNLMVLTHDGTIEEFEISPWSTQMDRCVVYLDEVHTRGTDLKLPTDSMGVVTLGPALAKDRLVQACMRMRQLGQGQSVGFFAPPEVDRQIREQRPKDPKGQVCTVDVLRWAMHQTCVQIVRNIPLWASQGCTYQWRRNTWLSHRSRLSEKPSLIQLREALLENEARSLSDSYGIPRKNSSILPLDVPIPAGYDPKIRADLSEIRKTCKQFEVSSLQDVRVQEEQEREVEQEVIQETDREKPPKKNPLNHRMHSEILSLIDNWVINPDSTAYTSAFTLFRKSSFARFFEESAWTRGCTVFASKDFAIAVELNSGDSIDDYIRYPTFILSNIRERPPKIRMGSQVIPSSGSRSLLIISPYEANEILRILRTSIYQTQARLHVYAPRTAPSMKSLEELSYCYFPETGLAPDLLSHEQGRRSILQLNLFAGQLFLRDYQTYQSLCHDYLGILIKGPNTKDDTPVSKARNTTWSVGSDGFVSNNSSRKTLRISANVPFKKSPIPFLKEVFVRRQKGHKIDGTHMGDVLGARILHENTFEISANEKGKLTKPWE